jgi:hypothetical protein
MLIKTTLVSVVYQLNGVKYCCVIFYFVNKGEKGVEPQEMRMPVSGSSRTPNKSHSGHISLILLSIL